MRNSGYRQSLARFEFWPLKLPMSSEHGQAAYLLFFLYYRSGFGEGQ
jgi:hypothetical protein